jgi:hypothetical protein
MASFEHTINTPYLRESDRGRHVRPSFSSQITTDRLRECERRSSSTKPITRIKQQRRSIFREEGLDDLNRSVYHTLDINLKPVPDAETEDTRYRNVTFDGILKDHQQEENVGVAKSQGNSTWLSKFTKASRPVVKTSTSAPSGSFSTLSRSALIVFLIAVVVPGLRYSNGKGNINISGVDAGVIRTAELVENGSTLEGRQNSPTSVCTRWSHQSTFGLNCSTFPTKRLT